MCANQPQVSARFEYPPSNELTTPPTVAIFVCQGNPIGSEHGENVGGDVDIVPVHSLRLVLTCTEDFREKESCPL